MTNPAAAATRRDPLRLIGPEEESAVLAARLDDWGRQHEPGSDYAEWVLARFVQATVRLDRNLAHESAVRAYEAERADLSWDDDRRLEAEELGARIRKDPARVRRRLEATPQGADWLIERWDALSRIAVSGREWSDPQRELALDLLGTPPSLRDGALPFDPDPYQAPASAQATVAFTELQRLTTLRDRLLAPRDERERALASSGVSLRLSPAMLRLQREEAFWTRESHRAFSEFRRSGPRPNDPPAPGPNPRSSHPSPPPEPGPEPEPVTGPDPSRSASTPADLAAFDRMILTQLLQAREALGIEDPFEAVDLTSPPSPVPQGNRHARRAHEARMRSQH